MSKKTGWFKNEVVDLSNSNVDLDNNFDIIFGTKTHVEDFIGGKATFKITFWGKSGKNIFATKTDCTVTFRFPKGWTIKKMLETGLNELGFKTTRHELHGWVQVKGVK